MKWWLVLVAFVLGLVVTWLLTSRRDGPPVPSSGTAVSEGGDSAEREDDDASAFGGAPSEFSSDPGAAESWHRDSEDEDALMAREPAADAGELTSDVPPVAESTPNGDLAGVGEPEAVQAVDAVTIDADPAGADEEPDKPTPRA
ncbi:MAG: hypothetical protein HOQ27_04985 [Dermatophilaceae bacterium]|nr:hypothetical protein [Dermatophilaceae bacterium]